MTKTKKKILNPSDSSFVGQPILNHRQATVLSLFKDENARKLLAPNSVFEEEFSIDVIGNVNVGEDYPRQNPVPWKEIALALLMGKTPSQALGVLEQVIRNGPMESDLEEKLKSIGKHLLGSIPCKGKVTGSVIVRLRK